MSNNSQSDWNATQHQQDTLYDNNATVPFHHDVVPPHAQPTVQFSSDFSASQPSYGQGMLPHDSATVSMDAAFQETLQPDYRPLVPPHPYAYSEQMQPGVMPAGMVAPKKKPASKKTLLTSIVVLIVLIFVIGGVMLLSSLNGNANNQAVAATPVAVSTPTIAQNVATKNIYTPYLTRYRATIRDQIAQDLQLSPTQLETQLSAGKTLSSIAAAQGISEDQLQASVTKAFQHGFEPAINNGNLTQTQVDLLIMRMHNQPLTLDRYLMAQIKKATGAKSHVTLTDAQ